MGGHAAGEVASEMARRHRQQGADRCVQTLDDGAVPDRVADSLRKANLAIYRRTIDEVDKQGMGTTVSVLMLAGARYLIGQVGDSRVYLLRENRLSQVTKDHSYVQEQVDAGFLTPEQARYHPYSNVITRCVGAGEAVEPDTYTGEMRTGDVFLVASDGPDRHGRGSSACAAARVARIAGPHRRCAHRGGERTRWPRQTSPRSS